MAVHIVVLVVAKLKLTSCGIICSHHIISSLWPLFVLKLSMGAVGTPASLSDAVVSLRLFLFRLYQVLFHDAAPNRLQRALHVIRGRLFGEAAAVPELDEVILREVALVTL